ncbi:MAG: glycosyltransferase [Chitinivibrionales bacterium]|nr:glycosyltransferase [Chitinivibrionales bacterium]
MIAVTLTVLCWCIGVYLLWRIPQCTGRRDGADEAGCTVIIPARNEAANLPRLLDSLKPQLAAPDEIIVVNDHSTDATAAVAAARKVKVIKSKPRPEGWTGKTWACWQGAQAARNALLLFVDADTWFAPGAFGRMVATVQRTGGLVSVQPYHCMQKPYERLSALFNLMIVMGVNAFRFGRVNRAPAGSFGPCILCRRDDYFAVGGHARVRGWVLENLRLGRLFQDAGLGIRCYGGARTLFFRMYPNGLRDLIDGWSKGIASGAAYTPPAIMALILGWITGAFGAAILTAAVVWSGSRAERRSALTLYALYAAQLYWMLRRIGNFGVVACLLFPLHLVFFTLMYLRSFVAVFVRREVKWKGRAVSVPGRPKAAPAPASRVR